MRGPSGRGPRGRQRRLAVESENRRSARAVPVSEHPGRAALRIVSFGLPAVRLHRRPLPPRSRLRAAGQPDTAWPRLGTSRDGLVLRGRRPALRLERRPAGARRHESDRVAGPELPAVFSPRVHIGAVPAGNTLRRQGRSADAACGAQRSAARSARPLVASGQSARLRHRAADRGPGSRSPSRGLHAQWGAAGPLRAHRARAQAVSRVPVRSRRLRPGGHGTPATMDARRDVGAFVHHGRRGRLARRRQPDAMVHLHRVLRNQRSVSGGHVPGSDAAGRAMVLGQLGYGPQLHGPLSAGSGPMASGHFRRDDSMAGVRGAGPQAAD